MANNLWDGKFVELTITNKKGETKKVVVTMTNDTNKQKKTKAKK